MAAKGSSNIKKPLTPSEIEPEHITFANVYHNPEYNSRSSFMKYKNERFMIAVRGSVVLTMNKPQNAGSTYSIYMDVKDTDFTGKITEIEEHLINVVVDNAATWFSGTPDITQDDARQMLRNMINTGQDGNHKMGINIGKKARFTGNDYDGLFMDIPDGEKETKLVRGSVIDMIIELSKIKLGADKFSIGANIEKIKIVGFDEAALSKACVDAETFDVSLVELGKPEQHEKGGKFTRVKYNNSILRIRVKNVSVRIFKNVSKEEGDKVNYSMSLRLDDAQLETMFSSINDAIFKQLLANNVAYYGGKGKNEKMLSAAYKPILSYNEEDAKKVKAGLKPEYRPSVWLKLYYSEQKGFDGKIVDASTNQPVQNPDDLIGKNLEVPEMEFYCKHIWFGQKTSVNFTVDRCKYISDVAEYELDPIIDVGAGAASAGPDEALNSDDE